MACEKGGFLPVKTMFGENSFLIGSKAKVYCPIVVKVLIYYTFHDHAPVRFHRAIYCLRELRLGKSPFPLKSRNSRKVMLKIWKKGFRKNKGINPRDRYYI
jgi:hypothetical protein